MNTNMEKKYVYVVQDKSNADIISGEFDTDDEAETWVEENGVDYDHFEVVKVENLKW